MTAAEIAIDRRIRAVADIGDIGIGTEGRIVAIDRPVFRVLWDFSPWSAFERVDDFREDGALELLEVLA